MRQGKQMDLRLLPSRLWHINTAWLVLVVVADQFAAATRLLGFDQADPMRNAEIKGSATGSSTSLAAAPTSTCPRAPGHLWEACALPGPGSAPSLSRPPEPRRHTRSPSPNPTAATEPPQDKPHYTTSGPFTLARNRNR
ncbi:hypothetical protein GCM10029992_56610 [Glycomyces albus]